MNYRSSAAAENPGSSQCSLMNTEPLIEQAVKAARISFLLSSVFKLSDASERFFSVLPAFKHSVFLQKQK